MESVKEYKSLPAYVKEKLQHANVFFSENYREYIVKTGSKLIYVYDEKFIIPAIIYEKVRIKYAMYASEYFELEEGRSDAERKEFLEAVEKFLKEREKIAWVSTSAAAFFEVYPTGSKRIPFGSHVIDLNLDIDELWKNVHSKHRNSIRRAEKSGVVVKAGGRELLDDYIKMDEETWKRSNKSSYGSQFFENIIDGLKENAIIFIAYKEGEPQAGACYFVNKEMCYYMYGASIDHPETGATNFMHWEVVKYLKEIGVKKYSFVGCRIGEDENSKYHNIQRFKERFGGLLVQGYMYKTILNPWKYRAFHLMYKVKNRCELTDAIDQEIGKWKELNE